MVRGWLAGSRSCHCRISVETLQTVVLLSSYIQLALGPTWLLQSMLIYFCWLSSATYKKIPKYLEWKYISHVAIPESAAIICNDNLKWSVYSLVNSCTRNCLGESRFSTQGLNMHLSFQLVLSIDLCTAGDAWGNLWAFPKLLHA